MTLNRFAVLLLVGLSIAGLNSYLTAYFVLSAPLWMFP